MHASNQHLQVSSNTHMVYYITHQPFTLSHLFCVGSFLLSLLPIDFFLTYLFMLLGFKHGRFLFVQVIANQEKVRHGRMSVELNDYPGSGANNRHTPGPQFRGCADC